ncbi:MAG: DegT/DnrJ/EryC1/StrS family aminotransferase [Myxococcota bacterium]
MSGSRDFIPALPTLWPHMLWQQGAPPGLLPFCAPGARFVYFARNAVWLSVKLFGLEGGEVLVPAYHHGVEIEALADAGAVPVFYRVGSRWDVDVEDVERRIGPRTRALYLIHYAGFPGPAEAMRSLADRHRLPLIEDCALSLLSSDGERPLGSTGDMAVFCLYKTLPVPHGGALVTNRRGFGLPVLPRPPWTSTASHLASSLLQNLELRAGAWGQKVRAAVRLLGRRVVGASGVERVATGTQHFDRAHVDLGISPLTMRIAHAQNLAGIIETRRRNYFFLMGRLREVAPALFHELPAGVCPLFFPLRVRDKAEVMARLRAQGIESVDFWRHFHPACDASRFPEAAALRREVLEIPCHQDLSPEAMDKVASAVKDAVSDRRTASPWRSFGAPHR